MEEAGSGKSVTTLFWIRCIPVPPGRIVEGESLLDVEDLLELSDQEMCKVPDTVL